MNTYTVFRRSCVNWEQFAHARKTIIRRNLTIVEARRLCDSFNDHRTPSQCRKGTKYEFTSGAM
jgi:hypothetical protein